MRKLLVSVWKEALLLKRDIEGIALIFIMPLILVIVIALLQHRTFQSIQESKIPVVIVDFDHDTLGYSFRKGISASPMFDVTEITEQDSSALNKAREDVSMGEYQIGIYIPAGATQNIKNRALKLISQQIPYAAASIDSTASTQATVQLFFDPITKTSFRSLAKSQLAEFGAKTEAQMVFHAYARVVDMLADQKSELSYPEESVLLFTEDLVSEYTGGIVPNAVQHNVPAWTLFGMFLICITIAGNIIKERNDGCLARIKTIPVSFLNVLAGKSIVFIIILLIQAALIVLVGLFLMPHLGLPQLVVPGNWGALFVITLASAFAATGYGIAIGTIASTQTQAATFGSISTIILAAIGGVWIPVMVMPKVMRAVSEVSPMNWGIQGYYDVFLRGSSTWEVLPQALLLFSFYLVCTAISMYFRKYHTKY